MSDDQKEDTVEMSADDQASLVEPSAVPHDDPGNLIGMTVAGRYQILRRLARGGMGVVYLAEQTNLRRKVVFKVLSYHLTSDPRAVARFEREAHGLSSIEHPNIVAIYDFGHENEIAYIVMEYVDGETLTDLLRRQGRLPLDQFLPIAFQICEGLAAAHEAGVVHRDLKPSNIMLTQKGGGLFVKVLDFGLAKELESSMDITKGKIVGTVSYLSPEVIMGKRGDQRADVYALGVLFYLLLSGHKPFVAQDDMSVLYQHVNAEPTPLLSLIPAGEVPQELAEVLHRCMSKDPAERPINAHAMLLAMADAVSFPSMSGFSGEFAPLSRSFTPTGGVPAISRAKESRAALQSQSSPQIAEPSFIVEHSSQSVAVAPPSNRNLIVGLLTFGVVFVVIIVGATYVYDDDRKTVVEAPAVQAPVRGKLTISSTPVGDIYVNGQASGRTPQTLELPDGRHQIRIAKDGFESWEQWVEMRSGDTREFDVELTAPDEVAAEVKPIAKPVRQPADPKPKLRKAKPKPAVVEKPEEPPEAPVEPEPVVEAKPEKAKPKVKIESKSEDLFLKPGDGKKTESGFAPMK